MARPLVIVFARAPRYGAVKTRLARDIGAAETLRFYRTVLARLLRHIGRDPRWQTVLCVTPDPTRRDRGLWPRGYERMAQGNGDLGRRMIRALRNARERPSIIIGSDIPSIGRREIAAAFAALGHAPFVLGPARDGGYWLIGARHPGRLGACILDSVRWSSAHALEDTVERLGDVAVLDTMLEDIDDGAAYVRFRGGSRSAG
jgi:rSAM/selenodomain-associated transferase 1